ncbi:hypothetical protein BDW22DRAFT_1421758 [Trametopsis cervina]|nr:hypothetical protein BDW22DRAFT_1421758 [Trametopsis cervina]
MQFKLTLLVAVCVAAFAGAAPSRINGCLLVKKLTEHVIDRLTERKLQCSRQGYFNCCFEGGWLECQFNRIGLDTLTFRDCALRGVKHFAFGGAFSIPASDAAQVRRHTLKIKLRWTTTPARQTDS